MLRKREGRAPNLEVPQDLAAVTKTLIPSKYLEAFTHDVGLKPGKSRSCFEGQCVVVV